MEGFADKLIFAAYLYYVFLSFSFQLVIKMFQLPGLLGWVSIFGWNCILLNQGDGDRPKRSSVPHFR
jgi:hypothetical protein